MFLRDYAGHWCPKGFESIEGGWRCQPLAEQLCNNIVAFAMQLLILLALTLTCLIPGRKIVAPIGLVWASQLQIYSRNWKISSQPGPVKYL